MEDLIIKKKRGATPILTILSLIMLAASVGCLFLPVIHTYNKTLVYFLLGAGVAGTFYFGFLTAINLFELIAPPTALVLSDEGIFDFSLPGGGAGFVPWNSINDTKLYGTRQGQYLGIGIEKPRKIFRHVKKRTYDEIMSNLQSGMPALVINCKRTEISAEELAEEIAERKAFFSKTTTEDYSDILIRREGNATLEDEERFEKNPPVQKQHATLIDPHEHKKLNKQSNEVASAPKQADSDLSKESIDDILRALELNYASRKKNKDKKEKDSTQDDKTKEHTIPDYRDFGVLFTGDENLDDDDYESGGDIENQADTDED